MSKSEEKEKASSWYEQFIEEGHAKMMQHTAEAAMSGDTIVSTDDGEYPSNLAVYINPSQAAAMTKALVSKSMHIYDRMQEYAKERAVSISRDPGGYNLPKIFITQDTMNDMYREFSTNLVPNNISVWGGHTDLDEPTVIPAQVMQQINAKSLMAIRLIQLTRVLPEELFDPKFEHCVVVSTNNGPKYRKIETLADFLEEMANGILGCVDVFKRSVMRYYELEDGNVVKQRAWSAIGCAEGDLHISWISESDFWNKQLPF